ncbi:collagen-like protein [Aequorivita sp. SDUM287046]|uniref:Collagen-like protein n=1 Tax=Aequorivita aurantiaca TaxID=3053356 RepID=A0ABT8DFI2_9FLAO|nr:collagen-like protein [Aequorivita aurantiaca]MDN3723429.1 collagen-like protein [Aequorivita aurantiaca]
MKNILLFLAITTTVLFTSCEGDPGPPGQDGVSFLGQVFETTVTFNNGNNYENLVSFPVNIEVFESDAVLVYHLVETVSGNGGPIDVWEQLPQTYFVNQGTLVYNFDHTFLDVRLFLDANFDLTLLDSGFTNNQTFRIAIVPAEFAQTKPSMEVLLRTIEMENSQIEKLVL